MFTTYILLAKGKIAKLVAIYDAQLFVGGIGDVNLRKKLYRDRASVSRFIEPTYSGQNQSVNQFDYAMITDWLRLIRGVLNCTQ